MISLIVPVYNVSAYIDQCVRSILAQTYSDLQIILVDDGSTDGSEKSCDRFADEDDRIVVIHKSENEGLVKARQTGLIAATGELVGFVDSDDWIEPEMFEKLYKALEANNVDIAMCGRFEDSGGVSRPAYHGIEEGRYEGDELIREVFPRMIVNGGFFDWGLYPGYWDKLFRRDVIYDRLMKVDEHIKMGEDAAGTYPCILHSKSIYVLHECLYHYRQTSSSMVRISDSDAAKERRRFKILYDSVLKEFVAGRSIYDLCDQWEEYLLFLMTPRADVLYEGLGELEYLFPFPQVKKGSKVIVYCAGLWGQRLYAYLKRTRFCEAVALADRNHEEYKRQGIDVISPDEIGGYEHDAIVVASSFARTRKSIIDSLSTQFPNDAIYGPDIDEIFSDRTMKAFGLI